MKKLSKGILVLVLIGVISICLFTNKKELKVKDLDTKKLAVFIKQDDGSYEQAENIPQSGYILDTSKSACSNGATPTWKNNTLSLSNLTSENTSCYLYFDKGEARKTLDKLGLTANTTTPDFSKVATTDEGIFATEDGMYGGTSYYWRGAATTNYVKFAGFCWRIIRINGDGSIRLIYDGSTCHQNGESTTDSIAVSNIAYNTNYDRSEYVGWAYVEGKQRPMNGDTAIDSNVKIKIEEWYDNNIGNNTTYASKIATGKFCNDRDVGSADQTWSTNGTSFIYESRNRLDKNAPTFFCTNDDVYTLSVGLITADEVEFAGGKKENNTSYYLYNGQNYWTMSPAVWLNSNVKYAHVIQVRYDGFINTNGLYNKFGLRPVINLRSDVTLTGNGTKDNPFVVERDS